MIRFFRTIRQKLINEGKTTKYIWYAFGEVALIVIGILIAVQIGKWNEDRADAGLQRLYLERLVANVERDTERLELTSQLSEFRISLLNFLLKVAEDPEIARGRKVEFMVAVRDSYGTASPQMTSDTFQEMISTGNIRLLDRNLYEALYRYFQNNERTQNSQTSYDAAQQRYVELRAGVLSVKQVEWLLAQDSMFTHVDRIKMETLEYDEASVVEAAIRLQQNQDLVDWIPQLLGNSTRNYGELKQQLELAEALLVDLKAALEESR